MSDEYHDMEAFENGSEEIIGNPEEDMAYWHMQQNPDTCAIESQSFIISELTGLEVSEDELVHEAEENGWYHEGEGTSIENVGNLLEYYGIDTERDFNNDMEELTERLEEGEKVIVGLDSSEIWDHGVDAFLDNTIDEITGREGNDADHAVEVIGLKINEDGKEEVILNDPGIPDGAGFEVPLEEFQDAWNDSHNFMVSTNENEDINIHNDSELAGSALGISLGNCVDESFWREREIDAAEKGLEVTAREYKEKADREMEES